MVQMAKTKKVKKGATKEGYLRHTKFIMGAPSQGGHSKGVLAVYMVDGSRMDFYSKDYKHLMPLFDRFCSFEQYGLHFWQKLS